MKRHEIKLIVKQILCIKLVKYRDKYTEMHGQQNVKKKLFFEREFRRRKVWDRTLATAEAKQDSLAKT